MYLETVCDVEVKTPSKMWPYSVITGIYLFRIKNGPRDISFGKNPPACSEETLHTNECHANVNADVNGIRTEIYLFPLLRGKGTKSTFQHTSDSAEYILRHAESYICCWSSAQFTDFQQKINRSRSHPSWINAEVT